MDCLTATGLADHPAVKAWRHVGSRLATPTGVTPLKPRRKATQKSAVYRLHGAGADGAHVVAKQCDAEIAARERIVYEHVLPLVDVPALHYYGWIDEPETGRCWLFVEDAGDDECVGKDRIAFAGWLARMHVSAAVPAAGCGLPDGGSARYRLHLRSGMERVAVSLKGGHRFDAGDLALLHRVLQYGELLDCRWSEVERLAGMMPPTLVHGDLSKKNVRVRRDEGDCRLFALDWETAGWGSAAADLCKLKDDGTPDTRCAIDRYVATVAPLWTCTRADVEVAAHVGLIFRAAAAIDWASPRLSHTPPERGLWHLRSYERYWQSAISCFGWDR